jgi:cold-inducible RNA-binding protein
LGERLNRTQEVDGSIPFSSTTYLNHVLFSTFFAANPRPGGDPPSGTQMKLYVGNLAYSQNDSTLRALFEPFGNVESARVISDRDTGSSKGFGFVEMADADAQKAMGALNGREVDGRALRVNEARPQEPRTGGGGRGGYGRGRDRY